MLEYISSLLSSANEIELKDEKQIISYYLYSLFSSYIKSETYIDNSENIDYLKRFNQYFPKQEFYNDGRIIEPTLIFVYDLICYATKSQKRIYSLSALLIDSCRICYQNSYKSFQSQLSNLVKFKTYYNKEFLLFDDNIVDNFHNYFDMEISRIENDLGKRFQY